MSRLHTMLQLCSKFKFLTQHYKRIEVMKSAVSASFEYIAYIYATPLNKISEYHIVLHVHHRWSHDSIVEPTYVLMGSPGHYQLIIIFLKLSFFFKSYTA